MHLLCVLALDRFADYLSDQVSSPGGAPFAICTDARSVVVLCLQCVSFNLARQLTADQCGKCLHHQWQCCTRTMPSGSSVLTSSVVCALAGGGASA
jgi:hypothetical protein